MTSSSQDKDFNHGDGGSKQGVAALERALSILGCFTAEDKGLTLTEIADRTGLYKSTILRLCEVAAEVRLHRPAREWPLRIGRGDLSIGPYLPALVRSR